jgi:nucleoside-diphosphate-sugar epimerase
MGDAKPTVIVTGISGNLGTRLLPQLGEFNVIGLDVNPPVTDLPLQFERMDLGEEQSCRQLFLLLRESRAEAVIHLAFILDPVRSGVLDLDRMWQINVAGTARVMEAITEANHEESIIRKFVFPSSVSVYGSDLTGPATEEHPLGAHTLPYAMQKMECDKVVQQRAPALRGCSAYMLRPHIFAGASVQNYMVGAFRGTPGGRSDRAASMRNRGKRPTGRRYLENRIQFVHVDDMARLITRILQKTEPEAQRLTVLNVAGRGDPLTFERCIEIAQAKLWRLPGQFGFRMALKALWQLGIVSIPPEAAPYMTGEYIMNTGRLRKFLGENYEDVIRYTIEDAFADCFKGEAVAELSSQQPRSGEIKSDETRSDET